MIPAMILVLFATVQFGLTSLVGQGVQSAANEAAREAGKGAPAAQVAGVVHEILNRSFGLQVAQDSECVDVTTAHQRGSVWLPTASPPPAVGIASHQVRVCVKSTRRLIGCRAPARLLETAWSGFQAASSPASSLASKQVH